MQEVADQGIHDPYDGVLLEYKNPVTGGHTFLTMTCHLQMLLPGEETRFHRHTGTTLYHTVQGQGATEIDHEKPTELAWDGHDSFSLPSWRWIGIREFLFVQIHIVDTVLSPIRQRDVVFGNVNP